MKQTLTTSQAAHILRADENANWSYRGAMALIEYFEELESDTGEEMELDVVAIRCDFCQYDSLQDWARDYFGRSDYAESEGWDLDEERDEQIREYIQDNGQLIEFDGGVIVSSF